MTTAEGFAPAKINLTLHVTGQRADGYHLLDSLVVFADVGDRLWYRPGDTLTLEVTGQFAQGVPTDARNLAWRAAEMAGWTGHIRLEKNLPHGAGIGGGSSDAAAVLRDLEGLATLAPALGADVPVCLSQAPQRMRGIGEDLSAMVDVPALDLVLVNPGDHVPTPRVFAALDTKQNADMGRIPPFRSRADFMIWLRQQRNDLAEPAIGCAPHIAKAMAALSDAEFAQMSGSGATCFGIFATASAAQDAADRIAKKRPDWWVRTCRTFATPAGQVPPYTDMRL